MIRSSFILVLAFIIFGCAGVQRELKGSTVKESLGEITVWATVPMPAEIKNVTQARAVSREAAVALGQASLLNHVLKKKTHSHKTLSEAEIPYVQVQEDVRMLVKGAAIRKTTWTDHDCVVVLSMKKSGLKEILNKN